jgi:hypothetical protein
MCIWLRSGRGAVGVAAAAWIGMQASAAQAVAVDVELQLLIDVSRSITDSEFVLQSGGYANAFLNPIIQNEILRVDNARIGSIAAQVIFWSKSSRQQVAVDWTLLDSSAAIDAFAGAINAAPRPFAGRTAPGSAIRFGTPLFADNGFEGTSLVMDVSGDGVQNHGANTSRARDDALAAGIDRINGLPIGGPEVRDFYQSDVIGGTGSFAIMAADMDDFSDAIRDKLFFEISGADPDEIEAPEIDAASGLGALAALGAMLALVRERRRKAT